MLRKSLFAIVLAAASGVAVAATALPEFPKDAQDEQDARVQAWYKAQCTNYADGLKATGAARDTYLAQCQQDMAILLPVGLEPDEGEEG